MFIYNSEKSSANVKLSHSAISNTVYILGMYTHGSVLKQKQFKPLNSFSVHCKMVDWEDEGFTKNINSFIILDAFLEN